MFRIKNDVEMKDSKDGECVIARCHFEASHNYDNIYNKIPLCEEHFAKVKSLQYGE